MITVYRIGHCPTPAPPPAALLASLGVGSTLGSGRWHSQSLVQVVYCGASRSLCQLEKRVHANGANVKHQALMRLVLPQRATLVDVASLGLPADWRADEAATRRIGNDWLASGASLGLWVPSYVEPSEMNMLLNPAHPSYPAIQLTVERNPFVFDPRMF